MYKSEIKKEGYLWKVGRKTGMLVKRYFVLKEGTLLIYNNPKQLRPKSKNIFFNCIDVIFLNGIYVDPLMEKGFKGFHLSHESEYFKTRTYLHKQV